jgi:hypothetical protein
MAGVTMELENCSNPSNKKSRFTYYDKITRNNVNILSAYDLLRYFLPVYFWTHLLRSSQCFLSDSIFTRIKKCNNFCLHGCAVNSLHRIRLHSSGKNSFSHNSGIFSHTAKKSTKDLLQIRQDNFFPPRLNRPFKTWCSWICASQYNSLRKSNKMQQCVKILFHIYMKLNMFRATRRPSSGA